MGKAISAKKSLKLSKINIIVIRKSGNNDRLLASSKPCKHCLDNLKKYGIKNVCYSTKNGNIIQRRVNRLNTSHITSARKHLTRTNIL
jgi:hypothetical protein